jgi:hypothetical protein
MKPNIPTAKLIEGNQALADFMGYVYKCTSPECDYHHRQIFNEDGTPRRSGTAIDSEWDIWAPHKDWRDLMEIINKISALTTKDHVEVDKASVTMRGCVIKAYRYPFTPADHTSFITFYIEGNEIDGRKITKMEAVWRAAVDFAIWYHQIGS